MIANCGTCLGGSYKCQPVWIGLGASGRNDLNGLAILQGRPQGHEPPVYFCRNGPVTNISVDGIGKIDGRRTFWQRHDVALGSKNVNLVREQIDLDALEKLF